MGVLPPELLLDIFDSALGPADTPPRDTYSLLLSLALVSKSWSSWALPRLYQHVHLRSPDHIDAWVEKGGRSRGRHRTRTLQVEGGMSRGSLRSLSPEKDGMKILAHFNKEAKRGEGVERLLLEDCVVSQGFLGLRGLEDVKTLKVRKVFWKTIEPVPFSVTLPGNIAFSLSTLSLDSTSGLPHPVLSSIFLSSAHTIKTLELDPHSLALFIQPSVDSKVLGALESMVPNLTHLAIDPHGFPTFYPFLHAFTSITHLSLSALEEGMTGQLLERLPGGVVRVVTLREGQRIRERMGDIVVRAVELGVASLERLWKMEVMRGEEEEEWEQRLSSMGVVMKVV